MIPHIFGNPISQDFPKSPEVEGFHLNGRIDRVALQHVRTIAYLPNVGSLWAQLPSASTSHSYHRKSLMSWKPPKFLQELKVIRVIRCVLFWGEATTYRGICYKLCWLSWTVLFTLHKATFPCHLQPRNFISKEGKGFIWTCNSSQFSSSNRVQCILGDEKLDMSPTCNASKTFESIAFKLRNLYDSWFWGCWLGPISMARCSHLWTLTPSGTFSSFSCSINLCRLGSWWLKNCQVNMHVLTWRKWRALKPIESSIVNLCKSSGFLLLKTLALFPAVWAFRICINIHMAVLSTSVGTSLEKWNTWEHF